MEIIESKENKLIKSLKKLKQKKYRDSENKFLAEGYKFLDYNYSPEIIIIREDIYQSNFYFEKLNKFSCKKIVVTTKIFEELSSQENSQGVIILYNKKNNDLESLSNNLVILDDVSDPGNLGTIIRICDATNFKDIILTKRTVDAYNEKVIRATMGSILNVNLYYLEKSKIINFLKENNYSIISTYLDKTAIPYNKIELKEKNAIVFGNEGNGISSDFINITDYKTIIPILSNTESLNVAVATGIILYKFREIEGAF